MPSHDNDNSSGDVFLIGGGRDEATAEAVFGPFLRAASAAVPRILCVLVDEGDGAKQFAEYDAVLRQAGDCTPVPLLLPIGQPFEVEALAEDVDGLFVCGGLTPAYQEAFAGCREQLAGLLAERGLPYAGYSAGAAVAARDSVVGGWLSDGVVVCPPDTAEDLEEIEVRPGLGLVPFGVDVHAAQWGTLPRLVALVADGRSAHGVAVDEHTVVRVTAEGRAHVAGRGRAHSVRPAPGGGALVRSYGPGESFSAV
ncbi:Type 1 glutamine amidotransferase-like domain-containing protein [Streptomyces sp. NPDC013178]|uniref:Type 1 glutamine amidotransferase-like domain-containing protein n=1 Tax=unclassified Streptomyces TaxID=2593676 RepID=UPI003403AC1F